jgi:hypothetical protein
LCYTYDNQQKNYIIVKELRIINRDMNTKSKATSFCECGIPEGAIHGWTKAENKSHSFIDSTGDDIGLQRKKTTPCKHS